MQNEFIPDIEEAPVITALRLRGESLAPAGRRLGLRSGDVLTAINGIPFRGDEAALASRFAARGKGALALTFLRETESITVLAETAGLGRWESIPFAPGTEVEEHKHIDPAGLRNYEVMRSMDGLYDLHPSEASVMALIAPPLWLLQARLWVPGATVLAALVAAAVVSPLMSAVVWLAAGLWVRRQAAHFLRMDRHGRGLAFAGVIAAPSEREAHARHAARHPEDRYLFAAEPRPTEQTA